MTTRPFSEYDHVLKVLLIGDSGVGKTALLAQFVDEVYSPNFISTIGVDFKIKTMTVNGKYIKVSLWDTAGQDRFRTITSSYYRSANGIIVCFDVTDPTSFKNVTSWMNEIDRHASPDVYKILVGTKADLIVNRLVDYTTAKEFADRMGIGYMETSSKERINVNELFNKIVTDLISRGVGRAITSAIPFKPETIKEKSCSCT